MPNHAHVHQCCICQLLYSIGGLASPTAEERVKSDGSPYTRGHYTEKLCPFFWHNMSVLPPSFVLMILMTMLSPSKMMNASCIFKDKLQYSMYILSQLIYFLTILCSSGNKKRLQALVKTQLSERSHSISQELVYSAG